jgi:two-component system nitrate/nitrite response regulator NarL
MNALSDSRWTIVRFLGYRARSTTVTVMTGDGSPKEHGRCPRVMVVDDHDLFRTGLRTLLQHEGYKTIDAPSGAAALATARSFRPEVVVMDMNMPGLSGIDAARMLLVEHPGLAILMLTVVADRDEVLDAIAAGACGYLLKDAELTEIVAGVEAAAAGQSAISPRVAPMVLDSVRAREARQRPVAACAGLSRRERAVLALMVDGHHNSEIARRLYVSPSTVKNHVSHVFEKLGVRSRVQAATFAVVHGLVAADELGAIEA